MNSQNAFEIAGNERHWPGRVLVGVDSSPNGEPAVEWAIREVAARGSSLRIGSNAQRSMCFDGHGVGDLQQKRLARLLREVRDEHPSLAVELAAGHGNPRHALLEEAGNADLLGSVALSVAQHAHCPVTVTHPTLSSASR